MIHIDALLHLRILVSALGESHHSGWWKSQFLSPTGLSFLDRVTPRSRFAAAVRSASRSALIIHDESIGKGHVFHLFRLPGEQEFELEEQLASRAAEFEYIYSPLLSSRDGLLQALSTLAAGKSAEEAQGPVLIHIDDKEFIPTLASIYLHAFRTSGQVFPYFEKIVA